MTLPLGAALAAAAIIAGLLLAVAGAAGTRGPSRPPGRIGPLLDRLVGVGLSLRERRARRLRLTGAAAALAAGWLYSGIPVVGIGLAAAAAGVPWLFGAARAQARAIDRLEAIEVWTRRLADLVRSGSGLHQAIVVGAADAPAAIATEIGALAAELRSQMSTGEALRRFAGRLADAHADEVVAALMLGAREHGPRLADVLDRIGENIAEVVTMLREQSAGRTDARISGLILSCLTLAGMVAVLVNRDYTRPYHTALGQLVLAACLAAFAGLLTWCRVLGGPRRIPRLLRPGMGGTTARREGQP